MDTGQARRRQALKSAAGVAGDSPACARAQAHRALPTATNCEARVNRRGTRACVACSTRAARRTRTVLLPRQQRAVSATPASPSAGRVRLSPIQHRLARRFCQSEAVACTSPLSTPLVRHGARQARPQARPVPGPHGAHRPEHARRDALRAGGPGCVLVGRRGGEEHLCTPPARRPRRCDSRVRLDAVAPACLAPCH